MKRLFCIYPYTCSLFLMCFGRIGQHVHQYTLLDLFFYFCEQERVVVLELCSSERNFRLQSEIPINTLRNLVASFYSTVELLYNLRTLICCSLLFAARGAVCVCGHQDHRQHHDRHHSAAVHVCLYWGAALQGNVINHHNCTHLFFFFNVPSLTQTCCILYQH